MLYLFALLIAAAMGSYYRGKKVGYDKGHEVGHKSGYEKGRKVRMNPTGEANDGFLDDVRIRNKDPGSNGVVVPQKAITITNLSAGFYATTSSIPVGHENVITTLVCPDGIERMFRLTERAPKPGFAVGHDKRLHHLAQLAPASQASVSTPELADAPPEEEAAAAIPILRRK